VRTTGFEKEKKKSYIDARLGRSEKTKRGLNTGEKGNPGSGRKISSN